MPLDMGIEFIRAQGPAFSKHFSFMTKFSHMRPSDAKKQDEVQV